MTQFVPDIMTYGKVASKLAELKAYLAADDTINTYQDLSARFEETIAEIVNSGQVPLVEYEEFLVGEPPDRRKMNRLIQKLESDFALIEMQSSINRAAAVMQFNQIQTEIKKNTYLNEQARDRLGVLQLYVNAPDANIINFGSNLTNDSEFDKALIPVQETPSLIAPGNLTLGSSNVNVDITRNISVKVLTGSNGFLGNNQQLAALPEEVPASAVGEDAEEEDSVNTNDYKFKQDIFNPQYLEATIDNQPNSWIEFEVYKVSSADKMAAGNFNFKYTKAEKPTTKIGTVLIDSYSYLGDGDIPWADGPFDSNSLKLNLEYDLQTVQQVNTITLSYHGLENNVNEPYKIVNVQLSEDGSNWHTLRETNIWLASDASKATARVAPNVSIGSAVWVFPEMLARYVRFYVEQPTSIPVEIGHPYFTTREDYTVTWKEVPDPDNPGETKMVREITETGGDRIEGPNPPVDFTSKYFGVDGSLINNEIIRRYERFNADRWAIGIRDIGIFKREYAQKSVLYTKSYKIDGVIDRVSLEADYYIPEEFGEDKQWIRFYVSPNGGLDWFPISRIQDDFLDVPEILAFNDPIPAPYRDPNVGYRDVDTQADTIKLRVELERPAKMVGKTPILRSYNLKVHKR